MNLFNRPPLGLKPAKTAPNPAYLAAVRQLPCCICDAFGEPQSTPTEAHHPICGRFSGIKRPDETAVPFCADHHRLGEFAIHRGKETFVARYGEDTDWIAPTQDRLAHLLAPA